MKFQQLKPLDQGRQNKPQYSTRINGVVADFVGCRFIFAHRTRLQYQQIRAILHPINEQLASFVVLPQKDTPT
jgi:hypothetical protein